MNQSHLDLEDWELLPDEGFLEINQYGAGKKKKIYVRNDYFICPPPRSTTEFVDTTRNSSITNQPRTDFPPEAEEKVVQEKNGGDDPVSQVFFNTAKEKQHLDMKVESPRSKGGITMPQIEGAFHLDIMGDFAAQTGNSESGEGDGDGAFNIWKWSSTGVGAIYSFGLTAAAVCIVIFSSGLRGSKSLNCQKLQFPISYYGQGKEETRRLPCNTIVALRGGAPVARARITSGGYYNATA